MFGRWRKNDGFKWVRYVPTQVLARRRARKEMLQKAAADAKDAARHVAQKSVAGIEHGVVQAGALAAAGAVHAGRGLERGAAKVGVLSIASARIVGALSLAGALKFGQLSVAGARKTWSAAVATGIIRLTGGFAGLVLLGAAVRIGLYGADRAARIALACGVLGALVAAAPALWRRWGPAMARMALRALETRRVDDGGDTKIGTGPAGLSLSRAGTLAAGMAVLAAAVGSVGLSARWIYRSVMAEGPAITGTARVIGPQLLRIGDVELRLAGIAAPELEQTCGEGRSRWRCGEEARRALNLLATGKPIACHARGVDDDGRRLARCLEGTTDIAEALVKSGHVWADKSDTAGYRVHEDAARTAKNGVWRSSSVPPWTYRERLWEEAERAAPDRCPIKGEGSGDDRVYHMPWSPGYARVRIGKADLARGSKQWLCTEREAREAGYKPASAQR